MPNKLLTNGLIILYGKKIRQTIKELGGTMPESFPSEEAKRKND